MLSEREEDETHGRGCRRVTDTKAASSAQEPLYARTHAPRTRRAQSEPQIVQIEANLSLGNGKISSDDVHLRAQETLNQLHLR